MKSEQKRIIGLIVIMAVMTFFMTGVTIRVLYSIAFNEQRERLVEICHFSGRLIEAMTRFNRQYPTENLRAIVLQQVLDAQQHYHLQDRALEIALAYRDGEMIQYVFRLKQGGHVEYPPALPWSSHLSQAMHLALSGETGTNISLNAVGKVVLAAYEPVPELSLGIVVKLEIAHLRAPYIGASIVIGLLTSLLVVFGALLFWRISEPIIRGLSERTGDLERFNAQLQQEVNERRRAEATLQESEERFRQLAENIHEVFWMTDPKTEKVLYVSPAYEQVWGRSCASLYAHPMSFQEAILPGDLQHSNATLEQTAQGESVNAQYRILRPDGSIRWIWSRGFPICDEHGEVYRIAGISEDITERKKAEESLRQAKEMADAANRAKSEFLAHINHELRTPLNGILGYTQILQRDQNFPSAYLPQIAMIHRSGEHLLDLINEMLDLAKIEAGRVELLHEEFHLRHTLTTIVEMMQVRAQQKDLQFLDECAADLPSIIVGDAKRLRQILLNLLGNAVKFTEQGCVTFRVTRVPFDAPGNEMALTKLRFSVKDTGIGIPAEKCQEIFQPFRQAGNTTYQNQGTGLGLTISARLVKLMGGEIQVESLPEGGSHFWFEVVFPEIRSMQATQPQHAPRILGLPEEAHYTILIVDDHQENREMLSAMLAPLGFTLIEADNGVEALQAYEMSHPDAIFMDMAMPEMDGFEATQQIRRHEQTAIQNKVQLKPIPIIAASADVYDQRRGLDAGCQCFLAKPIQFDALCACLQRCLQITWRYDTEELAPPSSTSKEMPLILPPSESLQYLYEAALIGDVMEFRAQLNALEKSEAQYDAFTKRIRQWLGGFQFQQIRTFLERVMSDAAAGRTPVNSFPEHEKTTEFTDKA